MLCVTLSLASPAAATVNVWFMPGGNGSGSSQATPRTFDWTYLTSHELLPGAADKDVVLHFMSSGPLPTVHLNVTMSDGFLSPDHTQLTQWRLKIVGEGARPEDVVLKLPDQLTIPNANQDDTGFVETGILSFDSNSLGRFQELNRLVVENLTLDCNWDNQKLDYIGPQYPRSFKTYGAHLSGRTGRVSKVIVRNYGSHGLVPRSVYDNSAGIETFPLRVGTTDVGQEPEPGDPRPWVVEDCEVAGFRQVYAGYNTAILAQVRGNVSLAPAADPYPQYVTPAVFNNDAARRVVMVRRCQVRGPSAGGQGMIGLGTAAYAGQFWSRHITFKDNILLNVCAGFNTDSGQMKELDFLNSLFWDVSAVGYLGAIAGAASLEDGYNISGNSIRFYGRIAEPVYRDFNSVDLDLNLTAIPARVLGAPQITYASGVTIVGSAQNLTIDNNWFTARPLSGFYTPDPTTTDANLPVFRPVWKLLGNTTPDSGVGETYGFDPLNTYKPVRDPALNVKLGTVSGNKVSAVSFDISGSTYLGDTGTFSSFTSTTSTGHTVPLQALSALLNSGFNPTGKVERLVFRTISQSVNYSWLRSTTPFDLITQPFTEAVSTGAEEVVIGVPTLNGNTLTVPVRLAYQPTPGAGPTAVTTPISSQTTLRLRTTFSDGSFVESSGSTGSTGTSGAPPTTGVAYIDVDITSKPAHSLLQFRAWWDAPGGTANWDEYQDAWATAQWARGTVAWVKASPDVANDQTLARGQFHFYRTGGTGSTLVVNVSLPAMSAAAKPATYGTSGDYTLVANAAKPPSGWTMNGTTGGTLTFGVGQSEAVLDVLPRSDVKLENNVVYLTVDPGTGYAVPETSNTLTSRSATVLIYDGPEYALYQLDDYTPILAGYPTNTSSYRFANATAAYALDNNANPKIAGGATYVSDTSGPAQNFGGWWTTALPFPLTDFWNDRIGYWQGFGAPSLGVSDDGTFVGQLGNNAFRRTTTGTTFNLPHLSSQNVSTAVGLNRGLLTGDATGRYIVGRSRNAAGVDRPVAWWGGTSPPLNPTPYTPLDLGGGSPPIVAESGAGLATAANDYGVIVGWAELTTVSPKVQRAFRSKEATFSAALPLTSGDELLLPAGTPNTADNLSVAWAVNSATSPAPSPAPFPAFAVGSAINKVGTILFPTAVFWPTRPTFSGPNPVALALKKITSLTTGTTDATAISDTGFIGGWSKDVNATVTKATLWRGAATAVLAEDLNDPHIVKLGSGWSLEAVTAINNNRVIVGNGKLNGKTRGFVMVPLPVGN